MIVPARVTHVPSLSNLNDLERQNIHSDLIQLVNQISVEIIQSFHRHVLQTSQTNNQDISPESADAEPASALQQVNDTGPYTHQLDDSGDVSTDDLSPHFLGIHDLQSLYSVPANGPPHPALSFLEFLNEITPTISSDVGWASDVPNDPYFEQASSSHATGAMNAGFVFDTRRIPPRTGLSNTMAEASGNYASIQVSPADQTGDEDWDWVPRAE